MTCSDVLSDPASVTVSSFHHDSHGRLIQSHHSEVHGGYRHIHRSLTFTGRPLRTRETVTLPDGRADSLVTVTAYDSQERPVSETVSLNGKAQTLSYSYDAVGRLTGRTHGLGSDPSGLTETLTYDVRDQLTGLNSNVFGMTLRYHDPALGSAPRYNGAVSEWEWNHGSGTGTDAWSLSYDGAGRLTDARRFTGGVSTDAFGERSVTYDRNGNVLTLTRYGSNAASPEEALAYSYNGNLLSGISNTGASGGGGSYTHDANGNMTHDGLSGLDVEYDAMNLTRRVSSGGTTLAEYERLADGTKLGAVDGNGDGYQYRGSLIYSRTATSSGFPTLVLDCALTTAGRIARVTNADGSASYKSMIHLRDHLGSVRAVADGDTGAVVEASDYYPFGKRIAVNQTSVSETTGATAQSAASSNRWRFSGKEDQSFLNAGIPLLDFGARMYNPAIARWTAADPMAEEYYGISPYAYCLGNPVIHVDDDGQMPQVVAGVLIGAAVGGVMAAVEGKSWREIGGAVLGGAVEGALASVTGGASLASVTGTKFLKVAAVQLTASAMGSTAEQLVSDGSVDVKKVAADGVTGVVASGVNGLAYKGIDKVGETAVSRIEKHYSSSAVKDEIKKEVVKEKRDLGYKLGGKEMNRTIQKETKERIDAHKAVDLIMVDFSTSTAKGASKLTIEYSFNEINDKLYNLYSE